MLLATDIGNTHTVFGLFDGARLVSDWRIATRPEATADEIGVMLLSMLTQAGHDIGTIKGMIVSSVVPAMNAIIEDVGRERLGQAPIFVGPGIKTGMPILYENPHEVGADRIVNAVAALSSHRPPLIVLDFGTATTFDVVGAGGEYLGGVIAPGVGLSADALFTRAARLRPVAIAPPGHVVGRTPEESMQSGLFYGYVALVEGLVDRIRGELGAQAPVIATGGLARVFESELSCLDSIDPTLTLLGLRLIWEKNPR